MPFAFFGILGFTINRKTTDFIGSSPPFTNRHTSFRSRCCTVVVLQQLRNSLPTFWGRLFFCLSL